MELHLCTKCSQDIEIRRYPKTAGPFVFVMHHAPQGQLCENSGKVAFGSESTQKQGKK